MSCTIAVTGATGNVGRPLAETLLAQGHVVRAIGRDAGRLQPLVDRGAEAGVGSVEDAAFLTRAYAGADAAWVIIPPDMRSNEQLARAERISKAHAAAIRESGVGHVGVLSSIGAHLETGGGIADTLRVLEREMETLSGVNVKVLRAAYFMENVWPQMDIVKNLGFVGGPVAPEATFPVVATRDVAAVAAKRLCERAFSAHTIEYVLGPRDISYAEITAALGEALGRDLRYLHVPDSDARIGLKHMGLAGDFIDMVLEFSRALNQGIAQDHHVRTPDNTTPTDIREFAGWFAEAYKAK
jgi:uncharacterized protein YbjT (DUF2867 family)